MTHIRVVDSSARLHVAGSGFYARGPFSVAHGHHTPKPNSLVRAFARQFAWNTPSLALTLLVPLLVGCGQEQIRSYRAPKDGRVDSASYAQTGSSVIRWVAPTDWQALAPGEMRLGNFTVQSVNGSQARITIIPLPGEGGSDIENLNRWRAQVGLQPVDQAQMTGLTEEVEIASTRTRLFDMTGVPAGGNSRMRLIAAVLRRDGTAWFFKMIGDEDLVAEQKQAFIQFLRTVEYAD